MAAVNKTLKDGAGANFSVALQDALGRQTAAESPTQALCNEDAANLQAMASAMASSTPADVNALSPMTLVVVVPVLDTAIYAAGDVLFATTAIPGFARANNAAAMLVSLAAIDKSDQKPAFTIDFYSSNVTSGAANAVPSISDADGAFFLGSVSVAAADWKDRGGVDVASIKGINEIMIPATGSATVYMIGYLDAGTPTFALGDLTLKFGVAQ